MEYEATYSKAQGAAQFLSKIPAEYEFRYSSNGWASGKETCHSFTEGGLTESDTAYGRDGRSFPESKFGWDASVGIKGPTPSLRN